MKQRWYDKEPTLSLAVSLLHNVPIESAHKCADMIIETAMSAGVVPPNNILHAIKYILKRWYDNDEILAQAMEYIEYSDDELRQIIAVKMINFLQKV